MSEIITFEGILLLASMKPEDRPENWKELVKRYIQHKEAFASNIEARRKGMVYMATELLEGREYKWIMKFKKR